MAHDMNDVIFSLGGVERITAPCGLEVSDAELEDHLNKNVIGETHTVQQVRAAANMYFPIINGPSYEIPQVVSMRQARLALLGASLLATVNDAVAAMTGSHGEAARIEWEYATEVHRDSPLVGALSVALSLDAETMDNLFKAAAAL